MKTIKETLKVPSAALQAMVDGLRKQSQRDDFEIDMSSFGHAKGNICFGCAATCTLQEVSGIDLTPDAVHFYGDRADKIGFDRLEVAQFEDVMDSARQGALQRLFDFFSRSQEHDVIYNYRFWLTTPNWRAELSKVEALIAELKSKGL